MRGDIYINISHPNKDLKTNGIKLSDIPQIKFIIVVLFNYNEGYILKAVCLVKTDIPV